MKRTKGLGRGLDALLGTERADTGPNAPQELPLAQLRAGKYQPRTRMQPEALAELAQSIRQQGVIQPILVRTLATDQYEIIAGERRFRAAQMAGLTEVPVIVRDVPDEAALALALIENIQREDLNPLEEAQGVQRLIAEFSFTHEQAAQAIGRSRSATTNLLRLLQLAQPIQDLLMAGRIDMGHARALLSVAAVDQIRLGHEIAARGYSVRQAEKLVRRASAPAPVRTKGPKNRDLARLEEQLSDALATRVAIHPGRRGHGQIVINYTGLDQLQGLIEVLGRSREQ
ncbi:MAG TPA: ParB/RepB/Spo0J family partition protein [Burkholderiaceae bacterium]|nr:ParB/RepB/Spo0J family partition protein [Burkholderiaceae bacterium]